MYLYQMRFDFVLKGQEMVAGCCAGYIFSESRLALACAEKRASKAWFEL